MSRRKRNSSSRSDFPMSAPMNARNAPLPPKENIVAEIETMLMEGKLEDALDLMDSLPPKAKNEPSMRFMYATTLMEYGDVEQSGEIFMELQKQYPHFTEVNLPLAMWYLMHAWAAHATRAAHKVVNARDLDPMGKESAQDIIDEARIKLQFLSEELNLPLDKVEQACWHDENGQMAVLDQNYTETEHQTRQALKIAPHWKSARNNHAYASYFLGKCPEAIAECESVLTEDPVNLHGLKNLAFFHAGLGEEEKAKSYADQLFTLWESGKLEENSGMEGVEVLVSVLGTLEDTDRIWQVYQKYKKSPRETLSEFSWDTFGVAAARLGHLKEARKLLEDGDIGNAPDRDDVSLVEKIDTAIQAKEKKLLWAPPYPAFIMLMPERVLFDLMELIAKIEDHDEMPTPSQQRQIKEIYSKYPFMLQGFKKMMWTEMTSEVGTMGLVYANQPGADAEILRFAQSDCGDDDARMFSLSKLSEAGRYVSDTALKFWSAGKQEWTEIQFFSQQIGDYEPDIKPESLRLIRQAAQTENKDESIAILRRVLEKDPTCAMAWYNLGAMFMNQGDKEAGMAHIRKSVEADPNYAFGHANLGLMEALDSNEVAALDHLQVVQKAKVITPDTASISSYAHMIIHINKGNLEQARKILETAKDLNPDHRSLSHYEEMLEDAEKFYESNRFLLDFQRDSRQRFHEKNLNTKLTAETTLEKCLSQLNNETLSAICEFWRTTTYGKKAEMVQRLNQRILDVDILEGLLKELDAKEIEALQWILDGGGWSAWRDFTVKFGSDLDESPFWKYKEPKTALGRLKRAALLFTGTLDDQRSVLIPVNLRPLLADKLKR
jgi:tetratricopeptide (TPR) repeat protein